MKDWHTPLNELNNGQVANLFYLANLAGLEVYNPWYDGFTNIGACNGHFSLWLEKDGKQITYKKAVNKLHKLIDREIDKEIEKAAMELYRELFGPIAESSIAPSFKTIEIKNDKAPAKLKIGSCEFEAYLSDFADSVEHSAGGETSMITACSGGGGASYSIPSFSFTPIKEGGYKIHFSNNFVSVSYEGEE